MSFRVTNNSNHSLIMQCWMQTSQRMIVHGTTDPIWNHYKAPPNMCPFMVIKVEVRPQLAMTNGKFLAEDESICCRNTAIHRIETWKALVRAVSWLQWPTIGNPTIRISNTIYSTIVTFWANVRIHSISMNSNLCVVKPFNFFIFLFVCVFISAAGECTMGKLGSQISQTDAAAETMASLTANKSNRHSFCEYKPFSTRKCDLQKLKFLTPNLYQSNQDECDQLANSNDDLSAQDGQFDLLPLIGESKLAAYQSPTKILPQTPSLNKFDDTNCAAFCDDQTPCLDSSVQCT